jgi:hypothetical protein
VPHREAGAHRAHIGVARRHHKGTSLVPGDIEQRFALQQFDAAHRVGVIHLDLGGGVEGDDRTVLQRQHLGLALAGGEAAAMAQHLPGAACRDQQAGGDGAAQLQHAPAGKAGRRVEGGGVEIRSQGPRPFARQGDGAHAAIGARAAHVAVQPGVELLVLLRLQWAAIHPGGPFRRLGIDLVCGPAVHAP